MLWNTRKAKLEGTDVNGECNSSKYAEKSIRFSSEFDNLVLILNYFKVHVANIEVTHIKACKSELWPEASGHYYAKEMLPLCSCWTNRS